MTSDKMLYGVNVDLKSLIKNIDECTKNPGKSSTAK